MIKETLADFYNITCAFAKKLAKSKVYASMCSLQNLNKACPNANQGKIKKGWQKFVSNLTREIDADYSKEDTWMAQQLAVKLDSPRKIEKLIGLQNVNFQGNYPL